MTDDAECSNLYIMQCSFLCAWIKFKATSVKEWIINNLPSSPLVFFLAVFPFEAVRITAGDPSEKYKTSVGKKLNCLKICEKILSIQVKVMNSIKETKTRNKTIKPYIQYENVLHA